MNPVLGAINLVIQQQIAKIPYRPYTLLARLPKESEFQSEIKWDANAGGATVSGRAVTTDPTVQTTDAVVPAKLPISNYVVDHTFSVLRSKITELSELPEGMAPRALNNLFRAHVMSAFDVIFPRLNTLVYSGNGDAASQEVYGLDYVATNANTYANLAPATYPGWVCTVIGNAGVARRLTKKLFADLSIALDRAGVMFDMIVTTPEVIEQYKDLFEKGIIITGGGVSSVAQTQVGVNGVIDIGYSGYNYNGIPIMKDTTCPNGKMWFIDSSQITFLSFAQGSYGAVNDRGFNMVMCTAPEQTNGINFLISELANTNPQVFRFNISVMPQLQVRNRKAVAVVTDIDQTTTNIGVAA